MPDNGERKRMAKEQKLLLQALLGSGDVPAGFDNERIQEAVKVLTRKRMRFRKRSARFIIGQCKLSSLIKALFWF